MSTNLQKTQLFSREDFLNVQKRLCKYRMEIHDMDRFNDPEHYTNDKTYNWARKTVDPLHKGKC